MPWFWGLRPAYAGPARRPRRAPEGCWGGGRRLVHDPLRPAPRPAYPIYLDVKIYACTRVPGPAPLVGRSPARRPGAPSSEVAVAEQVELDDLLPLLRARPGLRLGARREAPSREPSVRQQDAHAHDVPDVVRLSRRRHPRSSPPAAPARATWSFRPSPRERAGRRVHARRAHRCDPTDRGPPSPGEAQRVRTATASRWCVMGKRSNARSADSP